MVNHGHTLRGNAILLFLIGFFATWGEGMQLVIPKASLIYPLLVVVYIMCNFSSFVMALKSRRIVPHEFKYLYVFIFIHTIIYVLLNFQSIGSGVEVGEVNDAGFAYGKTESGIVIIRYFLFLLFSLYLTVSLRDVDKLRTFSYAYILGFAFTIIGGAYNTYGNELTRLSGGLQDPNAMAFDAIVALLFSVYLLKTDLTRKTKVFLVVSVVIELIAILLSFSRSAYLALFIWGCLFFGRRGVVKGLVCLLLSLAVFATIVNSKQVDVDALKTRISIETIRENKGAKRGYIWEVYLTNMDKYFLTGLGIGNSTKVMAGNKLDLAENYESHNLYIQYFAEYGIVGLFLYLCYWINYLKRVRRIHGNECILFSMGICMMIVTFFLNIDKGRTFWIVLAILNMIWMQDNTVNKSRDSCNVCAL